MDKRAEKLLVELGADLVCVGDQAAPRFLHDWTATERVIPIAVVRPRSTQDVSSVLAMCHTHRIGVVPQGGRTGLVGGAQPLPDAIILSLDRMAAKPEIDPIARIATVEAGVTLEALQIAAAEHGLAFPVDFGARGSCQIGGVISTNAGGVRAFRDGMTRSNVLGLEAVMPDGSVVSTMNRHLKNNTGYDLRQLFIGAEGTLGIVTRAVLRLVECEPYRAAVLLVVPDVAAARVTFNRLGRLPGLSALEAMWADYWAYACETVSTRPLSTEPSGTEIVLLAEFRGWSDENLQSATVDAASQLMDEGLVIDAALATSEAQVDSFWRLREANAELYGRWPSLLAFDISIAPAAMEELMERVQQVLASTERALWFGHMGDSNLHLGLTREEASAEREAAFKRELYDLIRDLEGSISAEHGIGSEKLDWIGHSRSPGEIALMQTLRAILDPHGIMNPGRTVPVPSV